MELQGKVKVIGNEQQVSATFKKRELVIVTDSQYPENILIEFAQDKTDLLNGLSIGQEVKVSINIRGREWVNPQGETKYFNSISGWKVEKLSEAKQSSESTSPIVEQPKGQVPDQTDDLPF